MRSDIFAGPICFSPSTEQENFVWNMVIFGVIIAFQWLVILTFLAVFKYRKTLNSIRKKALLITIVLEILLFTVLFIGSVTASTKSVIESGSNCTVADPTAYGSIINVISIFLLFGGIISGLYFLFSFNKK